MKAIVINATGGPDVFEDADVAAPVVRAGHVLIDVKATSVNPVDTKIRQGGVGRDDMEYPAILHFDVAGVVRAVGEGVTKFKPGDDVYGCAGGVAGIPGALADQMLADADLVALKPKALSFGDAAAMPLVGITAWEAMADRADILPRDQVLVHGGTGGVGHMAVQLAKIRGARVSTTVSTPEKAAIVQDLGADNVIFYRDEEPEAYTERLTGGRGFDVVFDTLGGQVLQNSLKAAKLKGHVVTIIGNDQYDLTDMHFKGLKLDLVFMPIQLIHNVDRDHHGDILGRLAELADAGQLKPLVDAERFDFTAEGVRAAHARLESGKAMGKVVIERA